MYDTKHSAVDDYLTQDTHQIHFLYRDFQVAQKAIFSSEPWSTVWQYGLSSFQGGDTKLEIFLPKNQHTQRKLLNFENWCSGVLSKIGHHF